MTPFAAERFGDLQNLSDLISPPYDVITAEGREKLEQRDPRNIVRLILPNGNGDRYALAAKRLEAWREDGTVIRERDQGVYVLRQTFTTKAGVRHVRTGLLAALSVEDYHTGRVKPHERTHRGPKEDRLALMRATKTMFEALFMLAPDPHESLKDALIATTAQPALAEAQLEGVEIGLWAVTGEAGRGLAALAGEEAVYIADGHHRYETAVAYRGENAAARRTLALIVSRADPGLVVLPTFRIVERSGLTGKELTELLDEACEVRRLQRGENAARLAGELEGGCVVCLLDGTYEVSERTDATLPRMTLNLDPAVHRLNVARVDALVVDAIRKRAGGPAAVRYSADPAEVMAAVEAGAAGVLLPATGVDDVIAVADAGGFMPQKSTYFQPKVPSGLVMMSVGGE